MLRLRFARRSQLFDAPEAEAIYLPIEELDAELVGIKYFSCYTEHAATLGANYCFPATGDTILRDKGGEESYCPVLNEAFLLTEPLFLPNYGSEKAVQDALDGLALTFAPGADVRPGRVSRLDRELDRQRRPLEHHGVAWGHAERRRVDVVDFRRREHGAHDEADHRLRERRHEYSDDRKRGKRG